MCSTQRVGRGEGVALWVILKTARGGGRQRGWGRWVGWGGGGVGGGGGRAGGGYEGTVL